MVSDDVETKTLRDDFFKGEIGYGFINPRSRTSKTVTSSADVTPEQMLKRIPERLQNVIVRACSSSEATAKIVDSYESFLVLTFTDGNAAPLNANISTSLLEPPSVIQTASGSTVAHFCFDSESSDAGFHRLLLHAVCQFHSLHAVSKTTELDESLPVRLLTVTGTLHGSKVRLSEVIDNAKVAQAT